MGKIPWRKELATHFSVLPWKIPWTEKPGGVAKSWIGLKQLSTHTEPQLNVRDLVLSLEWRALVQLQVAKGSVPNLRAAEGQGHGGAKTSRHRRSSPGTEPSGHPSSRAARSHRASPSLQLTWSRFWSWIPWSTWKRWSA